MIDIDLFYELCDKYGIELSDKYDRPMLSRGDMIRPILDKDVVHLFNLSDTYYDRFYMDDDVSIAC